MASQSKGDFTVETSLRILIELGVLSWIIIRALITRVPKSQRQEGPGRKDEEVLHR